mgnify:CR=1 FL=1
MKQYVKLQVYQLKKLKTYNIKNKKMLKYNFYVTIKLRLLHFILKKLKKVVTIFIKIDTI